MGTKRNYLRNFTTTFLGQIGGLDCEHIEPDEKSGYFEQSFLREVLSHEYSRFYAGIRFHSAQVLGRVIGDAPNLNRGVYWLGIYELANPLHIRSGKEQLELLATCVVLAEALSMRVGERFPD